jgi:hypothetical protein
MNIRGAHAAVSAKILRFFEILWKHVNNSTWAIPITGSSEDDICFLIKFGDIKLFWSSLFDPGHIYFLARRALFWGSTGQRNSEAERHRPEDEFAEDEFLKNSEDDFLKARFCFEDEFIGRLFSAY